MRKYILILSSVLLVGCATTGSFSLKPLAKAAAHYVLLKATSPADKIQKANWMWSFYHGVYSITPEMITSVQAVESYLIQFLPNKEHWQQIAHTVANWIVTYGFDSVKSIADGLAEEASTVVPAS